MNTACCRLLPTSSPAELRWYGAFMDVALPISEAGLLGGSVRTLSRDIEEAIAVKDVVPATAFEDINDGRRPVESPPRPAPRALSSAGHSLDAELLMTSSTRVGKDGTSWAEPGDTVHAGLVEDITANEAAAAHGFGDPVVATEYVVRGAPGIGLPLRYICPGLQPEGCPMARSEDQGPHPVAGGHTRRFPSRSPKLRPLSLRLERQCRRRPPPSMS